MKTVVILLVVALMGEGLQAVVPDEGPHIVVPESFNRAVFLQEIHDVMGIENINELFVTFAKIGSNDGISRCLALGVDVNVTADKKLTALIAAAKYGYADTVRFLLGCGAHVHAANELGVTALMYAAKNGFPDIIHILCAAGADINMVCRAGWSALMFAVFYKQHEVIAALLEYPETDVHLKDVAGQTAISMAENNQAEAVLVELRTRAQRRCALRWHWPFVVYAE